MSNETPEQSCSIDNKLETELCLLDINSNVVLNIPSQSTLGTATKYVQKDGITFTVNGHHQECRLKSFLALGKLFMFTNTY